MVYSYNGKIKNKNIYTANSHSSMDYVQWTKPDPKEYSLDNYTHIKGKINSGRNQRYAFGRGQGKGGQNNWKEGKRNFVKE